MRILVIMSMNTDLNRVAFRSRHGGCCYRRRRSGWNNPCPCGGDDRPWWRHNDRLRLDGARTLLQRRLVVVERFVAGRVLEPTANVSPYAVGRHHPHLGRRSAAAAAKCRLHVGADRLGAGASRRAVAVGDRRGRLTPVRADVGPDGTAPERATGAATLRHHGAVVDADVAAETGSTQWRRRRRRRSAEPRPEADGARDRRGSLVSGVSAALDRLAARTSHVRRFGALFAGNDVELNLSSKVSPLKLPAQLK